MIWSSFGVATVLSKELFMSSSPFHTQESDPVTYETFSQNFATVSPVAKLKNSSSLLISQILQRFGFPDIFENRFK